ncbi:MAG: hypothetical protein K2W95_05045 [Candidatus Obscuribacterales bacterium]|nr:hypothetical protein [Candidatus Obscuribacterales bacterium]
MGTSFEQDFRTEINTKTRSQDDANQRLFEDSSAIGGKLQIGAGSAAERSEVAKTMPTEGKKPPPFEIVDEKDPESKREAAIKEIAQKIKTGKFNEQAKEFLLEALNTGKTDDARRKSLSDAVSSINKELTKAYKESGETDRSKQYEIRLLNVKGADGTYDKLRIGLQIRKGGTDFNDSFMVRVRK